MAKEPLQENLENFICVLVDDYDFYNQDLPLDVIHKLLILIDIDYFSKINIFSWTDVQIHLDHFVKQSGIGYDASEEIQGKEIDSGNIKALMESLIILCSMVQIFNTKTYHQARDYFLSNNKVSHNDDPTAIIDDVSAQLESMMKEKSGTTDLIKNTVDTQELLDLITSRNKIIENLKQNNMELITKMEEKEEKIEQLNLQLQTKQNEEDKKQKEFNKQEKIFEGKLKMMEENYNKMQDDFERQISKMVSNSNLERETAKAAREAIEEEKKFLGKTIKDLKNDKKLMEANFGVRECTIADLKNQIFRSDKQLMEYEIKIKTSDNYKQKFKNANNLKKQLNNRIDILERKLKHYEENMPYNINDEPTQANRISINHTAGINTRPTVTNHTSNINNDMLEFDADDIESDEKLKEMKMRESEINLDAYRMSSRMGSFNYNGYDNNNWRDTTVNAMMMNNSLNDSAVKGLTIDNLVQKINEENENENENKNKNKEKAEKEEKIDTESADILYSVMSEYLKSHLQMKEYYVSKSTRERDIMKPFVIEQFLK